MLASSSSMKMDAAQACGSARPTVMLNYRRGAKSAWRLAVASIACLALSTANAAPPTQLGDYRDAASIGNVGPLATTLKRGDKLKIFYSLRVATKSPAPGIPPGAVAPANDLPQARMEFASLPPDQLRELAALVPGEGVCMGYWWITFIERQSDTLNVFDLDGFDKMNCK